MKTGTKFLVMLGVALSAGATVAAGPVQAAPSDALRTAPYAQTLRPHHDDDDGDVVDYFRTRWACERAGRFGEWKDRWESYDCDRVRWGENRGLWALEVERGWGWDDDDDDWDGPGHR